MRSLRAAAALLVLAAAAVAQPGGRSAPPQRLRAYVVSERPHDMGAFTQGLLLHNGRLYESTGLEGQSSLRRVDPATGAVEKRVELGDRYFGEGLARVGNRLYVLTWTSQKCFVFDIDSFARVKEFAYKGEGWGLCFDGKSLVMSNGSNVLQFRNPETFAVERTVAVTAEGRPVTHLNELECVDGYVYANIWQREAIAKIDPATGTVVAVVDASGLLQPHERPGTDVMNGIAYDAASKSFLLTGKYWPKMFEVKFEP